ncbi:SDR family oxidoreductase [Inquilinus sp.]|jgi:uncharacterized protein YbjT (DUF2867 family)|uniref:SDR family oxidoreductase n=1 Tax=Inquilinus sp. TaxID=1932117 RepID=UPI003783E6FE
MKVVIIGGSGGGTGPIGAGTARLLRQAGHEVAFGTGDSLTQALAGAQVVVDLADATSCEEQATLLAAEAAAGIGHHVALAVVDRMQRDDTGRDGKERLIRASGLPYTLIHSTQLFEFLGGIARSAGVDGTIRLPPAAVQPIAPDDVAAFVARVALGAPVNDTIEIAGPERLRLSELVARYLRATDDPRAVVNDIRAPCPGVAPDDRSPVPGGTPRLGPTRFEAWFHQARLRA